MTQRMGTSGRTAGKMMRKSKAKSSSERRGWRGRQPGVPFGDKNKYPSGKFRPSGTPVGTPMETPMEQLPMLIGQENLRLERAAKK